MVNAQWWAVDCHFLSWVRLQNLMGMQLSYICKVAKLRAIGKKPSQLTLPCPKQQWIHLPLRSYSCSDFKKQSSGMVSRRRICRKKRSLELLILTPIFLALRFRCWSALLHQQWLYLIDFEKKVWPHSITTFAHVPVGASLHHQDKKCRVAHGKLNVMKCRSHHGAEWALPT